MKITWYGAASLLIEANNTNLLFDPFISGKGAENKTTLLDFLHCENILITHGHFDHLSGVPKIMNVSDVTVYCGQVAANTLEKLHCDSDQIAALVPGNILFFDDVKVSVLKGKHVHFDQKLIHQTLFSKNTLLHAANLIPLSYKNFQYPEAGETLSYLVEANGKSILVLGSMALDEYTEYPQFVDLLILPYQGCSDLVACALDIIRKIQPRTVILDHFDNAYPPVSKSTPTKLLKKALKEQFPDLPVAKPTAGKYITLI